MPALANTSPGRKQENMKEGNERKKGKEGKKSKTSRVQGEEFFSRDAVAVAKAILGATLVRRKGKKVIRCRIAETEAYHGLRDRASHASRGKTPRNAPMFGPAGRWYVYFTYGMHWMLNLVTGADALPSAVLIRAVILEDGTILNGPAKLTKYLGVGKAFNGKETSPKTGLWIERGRSVSSLRIRASSRVGVGYAGPYWSRRKWRFTML